MDTRYSICHVTRFAYSGSISESMMEVRMQPRSDEGQRCLRFELVTQPRSRIFAYRDSRGNTVHHFDIPSRHARLIVTADAVVEMSPPMTQQTSSAPPDSAAVEWQEIDEATASGEFHQDLAFSRFACETEGLRELRAELGVSRDGAPLAVLQSLNASLFDVFAYAPATTRVDSPIDQAISARSGVCQDFAHIMIALVRGLGIPCRYVSGYLAHDDDSQDRSTPGATHAWVEAFLPAAGWIGFDPTNNVMASARHIRVAVGRDYGDVPPTRGVFRGEVESELGVTVSVTPFDGPLKPENMSHAITWIRSESVNQTADAEESHQQQQQQ